MIVPFWTDIRARIKEILSLDIPYSSIHSLLHIPSVPVSQYKKSMLPHLLNALKRSLPNNWKTAQIPRKENRVHRVNESKQAKDQIVTYKKVPSTWAPWLDYTQIQSKYPPVQIWRCLELVELSLRQRIPPQEQRARIYSQWWMWY